MMFASVLGVLVAGVVIVMASVFFIIGLVASLESPSYIPGADTVLKLKLSGRLQDNANEDQLSSLLMMDTEEMLSLANIQAAIRKAKNDDRFKGIYIEAGSLSAGSASVEAIRRSLQDFKESGKFVVAYADNYSQGCYFLSSVADKVFLNPQGMLGVTGLASQTMFYKALLSKVGIDIMIFKVGTYKGAVEPFMLDKLSEANREQIESYMGSVWSNMTEAIAADRNLTVADVNRFANEGLAFAAAGKAVEYGLVDELKYKPEAEAYVGELAGQTDAKLRVASVGNMKSMPEFVKKSSDQIAILYAEGEIVSEGSVSAYDMDQLITDKLAGELIKLKNDPDVKAVVLRVNSPGGSAYVSEQIWRQVVELKKVKPIVVSMGDVAASGGYYISCAASKIIAEPTTLTGSIGIFGMFPNITGLLGKLSLTTDLVKTNTFADLGDMSRPMRDDEKVLIQSYVERGYETFLTRCAEGRDMSTEAINEIGQGRVWTGLQAKEKGLVDDLGGMELAIESAALLAEITDYSVVNVFTSKDLFQDFINKQLGEVKLSIAKSILGTDYEYFKTLKSIRTTAGIQARLPYDVKPL